ncbi:TetR/AcrR family transcriptional regulator [bacterium]|nr:TetR/AcrR family transcriptional regulator [bacterium]
MGRKAQYTKDDFIEAALKLVANHGPAKVSMAAIAKEIEAPIGSVYHRFASREILLAEVWIKLIESFQKGFLEAVQADDGLRAALHTLRWVRQHPNKARVLLLFRRDELTTGDWADDIKDRAEGLNNDLNEGLESFTKNLFGHLSKESMSKVMFALVQVPAGAVRDFLQTGQPVPEIYDELVEEMYMSILGKYESKENKTG